MLVPTSQSSAPPEQSAHHRLIPAGAALPFFLVTFLFFLWGVPNNLNDVLIRQFMKSFALSRFQAGLVQSAFYMGYFVLATPAALIMRKLGYKSGFIIGLVLFGLGTFLFWPAAVAGQYLYFLFALFVIASGLSFLETASNPFIAQLGDPATSASRLNFAQAFNPLGAIAGVLVGTIFIFSGIERNEAQITQMKLAHTYDAYLKYETMRVVTPYLVLGVIALAWAVLIARTKFPDFTTNADGSNHDHEGGDGGNFGELLKYPHFLLAILAQFMYVGAQVGTWSYFIQYVQDYTHQPEKLAGYFLTGTLGAFLIGRFASSALMRIVEPNKLMGNYALINIGLVMVGVLQPGWVGLWAIFLTSFFMSLMFPTIFALGLRDLGRNTKIGSSLIVMAIVGGAVLTPLMGYISQSTGRIALAYLVPLAGFVSVAFYAFIGSNIGRSRSAA